MIFFCISSLQINSKQDIRFFVYGFNVNVFLQRAQLLRDLERHAEGAYESVTAHSELDTIGFTISDGEGYGSWVLSMTNI